MAVAQSSSSPGGRPHYGVVHGALNAYKIDARGNIFGTSVLLTEAVSTSALTLTGATQTASFPFITATQTWNNGSIAFTGFKINITNTASSSTSLLQDWQVGGSTVASVRVDGRLTAPSINLTGGGVLVGNGSAGASTIASSSNGGYGIYFATSGTTGVGLAVNSAQGLFVRATSAQFGAAANSAPAAYTIQIGDSGRGGTDTDKAGGNATLTCGIGTGAGAPCVFELQTPTKGSTGTTAQTQTARLRINTAGDIEYHGVAPAATSCGTSPSVSGNNMVMDVLIGTGATTSCTVTFDATNGTPWSNAPRCITTDASNILAVEAATTTTVLTLTSLTSMGGDHVSVLCFGYY